MKPSTILIAVLSSLLALGGTSLAKESGEKAGTADINIGIGDDAADTADSAEAVKSSSQKKSDKKAKRSEKKHKKKNKKKDKQKRAKKEAVDDSAPTKGGNAESTFKVEEGDK